MKNPFEFGRELDAEELVDRDDEVRSVVSTVMDAGKLFLIGPRRYGKTSILHVASERATRSGALVFRYNAEAFPTLEQLAARIVAVAPWTVVWLVMALACVPLVAGFLVAYPGRSDPAAPAADPAGPAARGLLRAAMREPGVLLGAAMLSVYVGLEIGVGNWVFSYLVQAHLLSESLAGYAVSGYWLGLTLGRFVISPVAEKTGVSTGAMIYGCLAGVIAAAGLAWLSPTAAVTAIALVLLGFFLGPIFPTTMSIAPRLAQPRLVPTAIGVMNAASLIGGSALPWVAGAIAQSTGIWTILPYALTLGLLQFAVWWPIARRIREPRQTA